MNTSIRTAVGMVRRRLRPLMTGGPAAARQRQRGQILIIFAGGMVAFMMLMAVVVDIGWYWSNGLKLQRAADAAALAGAVYLPSDPAKADLAAKAAAKANGYTIDADTTITTAPDAKNDRQLNVTITDEVGTFFMKVVGIDTIHAVRSARAMFILPIPMGSPLNVFGDNSGNFWGAINGPDTLKANGDPYATRVDNPGDGSQTNAQYKVPSAGSKGAYNYGIDAQSNAGMTITLFDPAFCQRDSMFIETGDTAWTNGDLIDTTFTLYAPSATVYDYSDDVPLATKTYTSAADCGPAAKNQWNPFASVGVSAAGIYRVNVSTTGSGNPNDGNLSNQFGIKAVAASGPQPKLYGLGAMSIFANMPSGTSDLYLAQIDAVHAGKTVEIRMFDPGDANGAASMQFLAPTPSGWAPVDFTYYNAGTDGTAKPGPSGPTQTLVTTTGGGTSPYNGKWVVVSLRVPDDYTADQNGWWKVAYTYSGGAAHDRTTWEIAIKGNPVHLLAP